MRAARVVGVILCGIVALTTVGAGASDGLGRPSAVPKFCRAYRALVAPGPRLDALVGSTRDELAATLDGALAPLVVLASDAPEPLRSRVASYVTRRRVANELIQQAWGDDGGRSLDAQATENGYLNDEMYALRDGIVVDGQRVSRDALYNQRSSLVIEVAIRCGKLRALPLTSKPKGPALPEPVVFDLDDQMMRLDPGDRTPTPIPGIAVAPFNSGVAVSPDGLLMAYQREVSFDAGAGASGSSYEWMVAGVYGREPRVLTGPRPTACASWISPSEIVLGPLGSASTPIEIVGIDGTTRDLALPSGRVAVCAARFTGDSLVVTARTPTTSEIWRVPLDGTVPERLVEWRDDCGLADVETVDGTSRVVVNRGCPDPARSGLVEVDTANGRERRRITGVVGPFDLTADGRWVVFHGYTFDTERGRTAVGVWALRIGSRTARLVRRDAGWPAWIP